NFVELLELYKMKTLAYGRVPKTKKAIPAYLVVLAEKLTPRFEREGIRHKLERLDCNSGRDYAWAAGEAVAGVIRGQMEASFNIWLLIGEASFFYISICFPLAGAPLLQLAALMALVLPLLRLRDAYAYPAEGSFREMLLDAAWTGACVIAFQEAARFMAPRLALPILNVYFAVAGAVMAAAWPGFGTRFPYSARISLLRAGISGCCLISYSLRPGDGSPTIPCQS